ncbi:MAG: glycosyltransferase family 4 protein [bacterium]|nr:glycosyltransferase family 4 protein [bacterium]
MLEVLMKLAAKTLIKNTFPCYIISDKPVILASYWVDFFNHHKKIVSLLPKDSKSYFLFQLGYHVEKEWRMSEINKQIAEIENKICTKNLEYIFLCNSEPETNMLLSNNLKAVFCNQNAFLDENNYKIIKECDKHFDAVYLARFTPVKRHELAAGIKNLKLIGDHKESEKKYFNKSLELLSSADWTKKVYAFNIYKHLNMAKVGLCLSPEEGAMFVSTEYLLCGLPVVSTKSIGGRDIYYKDEYVEIVDDSSEAVATGVKNLIERQLDPDYIRNKTIEIMIEHRSVFIDIVQKIYDKENKSSLFKDEWPDIFVHKLGLRTNLSFNVLRKRILRENTFR